MSEKFVRAVGVEDDAAVEFRSDLESDTARDVGLDHAGDNIGARSLRGDDHVNAGGARHLGDAGNGALHIGRRGLHEVGQLVDDDDDVGEAVGDDEFLAFLGFDRFENGVLDTLLLAFRCFRCRLGWRRFGDLCCDRPCVETLDIAQSAFGEDAVATLHLIDDVAQGEENLLRFRHHIGGEVGQLPVVLHLDDLRIDHDEAQFLGGKLVEHARDDRVDAHALSTARGAGDEQVRHLREVGNDGAAVDVFAEGEGNLRLAVDPFVALEEFAEDDFDFFAVGDLDAHGVLAGNGCEDVDFLRARGAGDVFFEADDAIDAHAACGIDLETGDGRSAGDVARAGFESELFQRIKDTALHGQQLGGIGTLPSCDIGRVEQIERRHLVVLDVDVGHRAEGAGFFFLGRRGSGRFFYRSCAGIDDLRLGQGRFRNDFFLLLFLFGGVLFLVQGGGRFFARSRGGGAFGPGHGGQRLFHGGFLLETFLFQRGFAARAEPCRHLDHHRFAEFDRMHSGHEDQAREIEQAQQDRRPDDAEQAGENSLAQGQSDPATRTQNVEVRFPRLEKPRLDSGQAGAGENEGGHPPEAFFQDEIRGEKLGAAESDEDDRQQIRRRAEHEISKTGDNRADRTDEIFRHRFRCALLAEKEPRRNVRRRIGNEGEEKQRAGSEQHEPQHFTPRFAAAFF